MEVEKALMFESLHRTSAKNVSRKRGSGKGERWTFSAGGERMENLQKDEEVLQYFYLP